jgi:hypothetical protein
MVDIVSVTTRGAARRYSASVHYETLPGGTGLRFPAGVTATYRNIRTAMTGLSCCVERA